jgi:hypothetical protein
MLPSVNAEKLMQSCIRRAPLGRAVASGSDYLNNQGVLGVFGEKESKKIVEALKTINRNADVA